MSRLRVRALLFWLLLPLLYTTTTTILVGIADAFSAVPISHKRITSVVSPVDYTDLLLEPSTWRDSITQLQHLETAAASAQKDAGTTAAGLMTASAVTASLSAMKNQDALAPSTRRTVIPRITTAMKQGGMLLEQQVNHHVAVVVNGGDSGSGPTKKKKKTYRPLKVTNRTQTSLEGGDLVCRVIARSDTKLPTQEQALPHSLYERPHILRRLDDIYHAQAHDETRLLKYMQKHNKFGIDMAAEEQPNDNASSSNEKEEQDLVTTVRTSLEDAGFELLSRRDLDLCEALNAGYLLRLSILPDVSALDPNTSREFYPECFDDEGRLLDQLSEKFLFDGRVLVFWRGYSQEVTRGRLLLPKIDYLQASLVQRLSGSVKRRLNVIEKFIAIKSLLVYRKATACFLSYLRQFADWIPNNKVSRSFRQKIRSPYNYSAFKSLSRGKIPHLSDLQISSSTEQGTLFKLSRYGGSKIRFVGSPNPMDALNPFTICEENSSDSFQCMDGDIPCQSTRALQVDEDMYRSLNNNELRCPYDANTEEETPPMQLLERVSISNLVDIFTREGRRKIFRTLFSKSELVEPTYGEVVVVWRPLPEETKAPPRPRITPPKIAYELADMFDFDGLPEIPEEPPAPAPSRLEIRSYDGVPMANLPAVLPKTKLILRPADAFVFDLISIFSFLAIAGSIKFDNPKLDLIALVSVVLWLIRTVIRYSNKLARYDLLVKKFLTSKISHRNSGALKYLATEAGSQRSTRAALVHTWLSKKPKDEILRRSLLVSNGSMEVNELVDEYKLTPIDIDAALNDLEDLGLIRRSDLKGEFLEVVREERMVVRGLKRTWDALFEGRVSLAALVGRRNRDVGAP